MSADMRVASDSAPLAAAPPFLASEPGSPPHSSPSAPAAPLVSASSSASHAADARAQISDLERRLGVAVNIREGAATILNELAPDSAALRGQILLELASSESHINALRVDIDSLHRSIPTDDGPNLRRSPASTDPGFLSDTDIPTFGPGGWDGAMRSRSRSRSRPLSPSKSDFAGGADSSVATERATLTEPKGHWLSRSRSSPQLSAAVEDARSFPFGRATEHSDQRGIIATAAGDTLQHTPPLSRPSFGPQDAAIKAPHSATLSPSATSDTTESTPSPEALRFSELLTMLGRLGSSRASPFELGRVLDQMADLLHDHSDLRDSLPVMSFVHVVTAQLKEENDKAVRARAYRVLRLSLSPPLTQFAKPAKEAGLHWYLVRTFLREAAFLEEREQALMLVRALVSTSRAALAAPHVRELPPAPLEAVLDLSVMRGLIAISYDFEDRLNTLCVETLAEVALVDPRYFVHTGCLTAVISAIADRDLEFAPALMSTVMSLLDLPSARALVTPGIDFEPVLAALTDPPASLSDYGAEERLRRHARIVATMMRSWAGLMYLCLEERLAIRSLITAIQVYPETTGTVLLDELLALIRLTSVSAGPDSIVKAKDVAAHQLKDEVLGPPNLMDHYIALLLNVLIDSGLVDALINIIENNEVVRSKATLTLSEVLRLCNLLLPARVGQRASALPRLFSLGSNMDINQAPTRNIAGKTLSDLDKLNRKATPAHVSSITQPLAAKRQALAEGKSVDKLEQQSLSSLDDATFRSMVNDSQVANARDPNKWNVDLLVDLLDGVLVSPRRFDEVMRQGRFVRRLCSFYHPNARRFSTLPKTRASRLWARLGTQLIRLIVKHPDGLKFLAEDPLLSQISDCLAQLDTCSQTTLAAHSVEEPLFSRAKLGTTVVEGYFEMLGVIGASKGGLALLERFHIFTLLHRFVSVPARDYIVRAVLQHLPLEVEGHGRALISHTLAAGSRALRLFATSKLAQTLQNMPSHVATWNPATAAWMVELMVAQMYEVNPGIQKLTIEWLGRICDDPALLDSLIAHQPSFEHLGEAGQPLMLKFLSLPSGFAFLDNEGYISTNLALWFNELNLRYSVQLEINLSYALNIDRPYPGTAAAGVPTEPGEPSMTELEAATALTGLAPSHFYAQLAQTQQGLLALRECGHFDTFISFIQQYGLEAQNPVILAQLKSMLWAVGNVGTTECGISMIESHGLLGAIVSIAEHSPVLSIRGVAFFVVGLFGRTHLGSQLLASFGWETVHTPFLRFKGIAVPSNLHRIILEPWHPKQEVNFKHLRLRAANGKVSLKILEALAMMGNSILVNKASMRLGKLRARNPRHFMCDTMRAYVLAYLRNLPWKQSVRRFVWELFDIRLDPPTLAGIEHALAKITMQDGPGAGPEFASDAESGAFSYTGRNTLSAGEGPINGASRGLPEVLKDFALDGDSDDSDESAEDDDGMSTSSTSEVLSGHDVAVSDSGMMSPSSPLRRSLPNTNVLKTKSGSEIATEGRPIGMARLPRQQRGGFEGLLH